MFFLHGGRPHIISYCHFGHLNFTAKCCISLNWFLNIRNILLIHASILSSVTANVSLHANAVTQLARISLGILCITVNALNQIYDFLTLWFVERIVIIIIQFDIGPKFIYRIFRIKERLLHIITAKNFIKLIIFSEISVVISHILVCYSLIYNIPAVNHTRVFLFKMSDYFFNIILKTFLHNRLAYIFLTCVIALAEEPVTHIRVPDKDVTAHLNSIFLGKRNDGISFFIIHHWHSIFTLRRFCLV